MNYKVQFQGQKRDEIVVCDAAIVPRKGDDIDIGGECFTVIAVMHSVDTVETSPGVPPYAMARRATVRVQ